MAAAAAALVGVPASGQQAGSAPARAGQSPASAQRAAPGSPAQGAGSSAATAGAGSREGSAGAAAVGVPARVVPGAVCVVPAASTGATTPSATGAPAAATAGFGTAGAPTTAAAGVPAVGRDPCVQLVACYARLAASLCARGARACRRAFVVDSGAPAEECRARLVDAGLKAAPWAAGAFTVPDACVD